MRTRKVYRAVKDADRGHPVPTAWRDRFRKVVRAFVRGDYELSRGLSGVVRPSKSTAKQMRSYVASYGETLVALPEKTWRSSIAMWSHRNQWEVFLDLWTAESGRSDMVLYAHVRMTAQEPRVQLLSIHVP